ncbi:P-loop containing nucleoside triphosphate hydrolase protein [Cladochytrium replicatum]|nr:P-loop containing nucleoside triphosphate hydrolase protein [Cladochytrium replicatum]
MAAANADSVAVEDGAVAVAVAVAPPEAETLLEHDKKESATPSSNTLADEKSSDKEKPAKKKFSLFPKKDGAAEKKPPEPTVSFAQLFRFSTKTDRILILIASLFSLGMGALIPASITVFGQFLNGNGSSFASAGQCDENGVLQPPIDWATNSRTILMFVYFGLAMAVAGYFSQMMWILSGENQTKVIREKYVQSILRQDLAWFDSAQEGSLTTRLAQDTQLIQDGISEKFGLVLQGLAQFIGGFTVAFVYGWKLALVLLAALPIMGIVGTIMVTLITKFVRQGQDSYADAGAVAEQVIAGIRTVFSFSLQKRFAQKYQAQLDKAHANDVKKGLALSGGFGAFMLTIFSTYALAFYVGSRLVLNNEMVPGDVLVVFFSMLIGAFSVIIIPPNLSSVTQARGAAYKIFATIDRVPEIDASSEAGVKPESIQGDIQFSNVSFAYPTRPDITVLHDLTVNIKPGTTVAFVGPSGSGKSTSVSLIQRFYNPKSGSISIDGVPIEDYNLRWLRDNIGVVSQEPVLFNTTIKQNILMGATREVSMEEIIECCKKANCHNFIQKLPKGYDTMVGEHGGMMSGGQKQRIAIARALVRNPRILLLDEATSALDTQSERVVQRALDVAAKDRTTIVIAHRLSTIRNADLIVVLDKGRMVESGTHDSLVALGGVYANLVEKQKIRMDLDSKLKSEKTNLPGGVTESALESSMESQEELEVAAELEAEAQELAKKAALETVEPIVDAKTGDVLATGLRLESYDTLKRRAKDAIRKERDADDEASKQKAPIVRVLKLMRPEWWRMALGVLGASIAGCVFPIFALIFTNVIKELFIIQITKKEPEPFQGAYLYSFIFLCIGIAGFTGIFLQGSNFEIAGAGITRRMRMMAFETLMRQEVGFFDEEGHSLGALTTQLATDASKVGDLVTKVWADLVQLVVTGICGLTIAFYYSWQVTLALLATIPLLAIGTYFESRTVRGFEDATKRAYEDSGEIAAEAFKEIRTVSALNRQGYFDSRFRANNNRPHKLAIKKAYTSSLGNGYTQAFTQLVNAFGFYIGLKFSELCWTELSKVFTVIMAATITAQGLGRSSTFLSTFNKAKVAAIKMFQLIDRESKIDPEKDGDEPDTMDGDFDFKNIGFTYPARPNQPIFTGGFNVSGKKNQTVALVGPSGCGKSTTIGMLQRWYDPTDGEVLIDGKNVNLLQVKEGLRKHMSIVGQEPVLFDMSLRENILAGTDRTDITDEELNEVVKMANISEFIASLPDGFETRVGDKGSQLSGGQKQRVAIARALIRKPRILLLDEATSALDSESEKVVQEAIDRAVGQGGRTTIAIAHRLSTIQDADVIAVIKDGRVVELGNHQELLALNGVYSALCKEQDLNMLQ